MDELNPPVAAPESAAEPAPEPPAAEDAPLELPRWVAPAIGLALVAIASMAVWTGFRPRTRPEARLVITEPVVLRGTGQREDSGGAPGDPGPGASRLVQSETGGAVPQAQPLPAGEELPRITIEGNDAGVTQTTSVEVRRGIAFDADRPDAIVYVNDLAIGDAGQYDATDQAYEFAQEGTFTVKVVAKDGTEARFVVVATAAAETDVVMIRVRLAKL